MLAKYEGRMEQTEEDTIEKISDFLTTIGSFKKYVYRLKPTDPSGGMTGTNIKLRHDVLIKDIMEYAKDEFREEEFGV